MSDGGKDRTRSGQRPRWQRCPGATRCRVRVTFLIRMWRDDGRDGGAGQLAQ